jgi:hypothetical protein
MLGSSFGVGPSFLCSDQSVPTYSPTEFCAVAAQPAGEYVTRGGLSPRWGYRLAASRYVGPTSIREWALLPCH